MAPITIGATVRHPSRGTGEVVTIIVNPLTRRPHKAWVEFGNQGFGNCTRRYCCFIEDLTPVVVPTPGRPALTVVEPTAPSAA
jgi:hypothetical protein